MSSRDRGVTRRGFIGAVGSSCAVLSVAGFDDARRSGTEEEPIPRPEGESGPTTTAAAGAMTQVTTDVLVVGGGMAGVFAAVKAHDNGAGVMLVDKGSVGKSGQTPFARGIFRFDEEQTGMSKAEYLERTAEASERMNNPVYTELLLDHSADIESTSSNPGGSSTRRAMGPACVVPSRTAESPSTNGSCSPIF